VFRPWVELAGVHVRLLDVSGVVATVGLTLAFVISAIRNGRALYAAEPNPRRDDEDRAA